MKNTRTCPINMYQKYSYPHVAGIYF